MSVAPECEHTVRTKTIEGSFCTRCGKQMSWSGITFSNLPPPPPMPWDRPELVGWDIIGMNHYSVRGTRRLFVAMVKEGQAIRAEGPNEHAVFAELARLAK